MAAETSSSRREIWGELSATARLAGPLIVGQVFQVGMGVTDTVMAGRLGARDLAAVALGTTLWMPVFLGTVGLLLGVTPLVAQARGSGSTEHIRNYYWQGLWLALVVGALATVVTLNIGVLMRWVSVDPVVVPLARGYLAAIAWGTPSIGFYLVMRYVGDGIGFTRPVMYVQAAGLLINALANYVLMYGKLGFPALGAVGCGWASAFVLWLQAFGMWWIVRHHPKFRALSLGSRVVAPLASELLRLLALGGPIAVTLIMETGLFTAVSLLMGTLGEIPMAAHQIALNYASLMFMVPLGLGMAITVRVGQAVGRKRMAAARRAGYVGMAMAVGAMGLSAAFMLLVPGRIVALYTSEPDLAALAVSLLFAAALFQISDGLQISAIAALRGLKDTGWPMAITFVSYWVVGVPSAYLLGIRAGAGPFGLWSGLIAGLSVAALLLAWRFRILISGMQRVSVAPVG